VHFRQRGLRDVGVLSHDIVIVRVGCGDAHYDRYLLRIHLLFGESTRDKRPQVSSGVSSGLSAVLFAKSEYRTEYCTPPVDRIPCI